jgi:hypothetical protein
LIASPNGGAPRADRQIVFVVLADPFQAALGRDDGRDLTLEALGAGLVGDRTDLDIGA